MRETRQEASADGGGGNGSLGGVIAAAGGVLGSVLFFNMANGGVHALIGYRLAELGASELVIGAIGSGFFIGKLIGAVTAERFVRAIRSVRAFVIVAAIAGLMTLTLPLIPFVILWVVIRFITGYCAGSQYVIMETWLSLLASTGNRGRTLGIYESVRMLAVGVAPFVIGFGSGTETFIIAGALYVLAVIPVSAFGASEPKAYEHAELDVAGVIRSAPLGLAAAAASGLFTSAFYGLSAVFAYQQGFSAIEISTIISVTLLAPAAMNPVLGWLADRIDKRIVIFAAASISCTAATALVLSGGQSFLVVAGLSALVGGFAQPTFSVGTAYVLERVSRGDFLRAVGTANVANDIANASGPFVASSIMVLFGNTGLYGYFAVVLFTLTLLSLVDMTRRYRLQAAG